MVVLKTILFFIYHAILPKLLNAFTQNDNIILIHHPLPPPLSSPP